MAECAGFLRGHFQQVFSHPAVGIMTHLTIGERFIPVYVVGVELIAVVTIEASRGRLVGVGPVHFREASFLVQFVAGDAGDTVRMPWRVRCVTRPIVGKVAASIRVLDEKLDGCFPAVIRCSPGEKGRTKISAGGKNIGWVFDSEFFAAKSVAKAGTPSVSPSTLIAGNSAFRGTITAISTSGEVRTTLSEGRRIRTWESCPGNAPTPSAKKSPAPLMRTAVAFIETARTEV